MIDFDIYSISTLLSPSLLKEAQLWYNHDDVQKSSLASVLIDKLSNTKEETSGLTLSIKFVKSVSTATMIQALQDSFIGCNPEAVKKMLQSLTDSIGPKGLFPGDIIEYHWLNGGGVLMSVRGEFKSTFFDPEIERRLLEVYIDPSRTVSPELYSDIVKHLSSECHELAHHA